MTMTYLSGQKDRDKQSIRSPEVNRLEERKFEDATAPRGRVQVETLERQRLLLPPARQPTICYLLI